jgi:acyl-CoA thioesterase-1
VTPIKRCDQIVTRTLPRRFVGVLPINRLKVSLRIANMKKRNLFLLLFVSACASLISFTLCAQVTIEPFGDSITSRGSAPESSFRFWLWDDLDNAGYTNDFEFVGLTSGVTGGGGPANPWPQEAYSGGEGLDTASALSDDMPQAAEVSGGPNIVLLEIGANDVLDYEDNPGFTAGTTETNLEAIIQGFASVNPGVVILMATAPRFLTTPGPTQNQANTEIAKVNNAIRKAAGVERKAGVDVVVVSFGGYNPRTDTSDGTHPNIKGEQYLAKQLFDALRPVLKKMGVVPQKPSRR